ncbi:DUF4199 domain-containing protein [Phocaeicola barnesiae]|jgi:hypothetical protein|uniref:DUF4199 domain-containing protein n=1 Tax=Phocaeicola barnesiae TaxID=376804 RepID=A0AAW5N2R6_9BACT|nr:DUF4199 domain-containing protein [Phocaeicola barnesiae]CDD32044.1 putative uncharacterized protein [Bacteroides sp. CAG:714]MCF2574739.1 DUF4199 domain-containing protein [Phocaeicola barnesiae]MCF2598978.1 DUF4199 domain-containing protein [Phocaeicola barnesiae]MCR8872546.1 DUF4199 domain-containing protein [Phocaeicola barnesiae]MDM8240491.1 DUF4199 domain-containing protein [Phocaeicola barnesiae]
MTQNQPISLQQTAMYFGTLMGLFWIIKFTFLPLGFTIPLLQLLFVLLTFFVPILGYLYARKFRNRYCGGSITFSRAFAFTVLMYLFAALLAAVAHYIYFRYIDNGFLIDSYIGQLEAMKPTATEELKESIDQFIEGFSLISSLSPIQLTFQLISQNFLYGTLLALPTALLVMRRKRQ